MNKGAIISDCEKYRYSLWRIWEEQKGLVTFICLNPSTADAENDDSTITRCINFVDSWGYGGFYMANLFAFRATKPKDMKNADEPIGEENDNWLLDLTENSKIVIAGWGNDGCYMKRDRRVKELIGKKLHYLKLTKSGNPWHPLYLKSDLKPILY